jgi:TetR/AcrR family transcriptional regulator, cholesterol catabolism regulator
MEVLDKILNASVELFRQYGFKTITMDDIARRGGISKKTLYQHFANKNEVVNESVSWYQCRISDMCTEALTSSENSIEGMVRIMGMFDQIYRQINPTALLELERFYPDGFKKFRDNLLAKDVEVIRQNLVSGIKEGYYREDIDPLFMAKYRMELSMIPFHPNLLVTDTFDIKTVAYQISEHFLFGIMTPKGEKLYQKYKEKYLKQVSRI